METREVIVLEYVEEATPTILPCQPNLYALADFEIPRKPHLRSQYCHHLMSAIETAAVSDMQLPVNIVQRIHDRLNNYSREHRLDMTDDHRIAMWILECRIAYLIFCCTVPDPPPPIDRPYLARNKLLVSDKNPLKMDVRTLWDVINVLVERINVLYYREQLLTYIHRLRMRCCALSWITASHQRIHNHISFRTKQPDSSWSVDDKFFQETECLFHELDTLLLDRIHAPLSITDNRHLRLEGPLLERFTRWFTEATQTNYRQFVEENLRKCIHELYELPGERERFLKEDPSITYADAINIIAKYRPYKFNEMNLILDSDRLLSDIAREHGTRLQADQLGTTKMDLEVDVNYDLLLLIAIKYYFQASMGQDNAMNECFFPRYARILTSTVVPIQEVMQLSESCPRVVQLFNEWAVVDQRHATLYCDLGICFVQWVKVVCEKPSLQRRPRQTLPSSCQQLIPLYDSFFPELYNNIPRMAEQQRAPDFALPRFYGINLERHV